jgi:predicted small metal-binding protein
MGDERLRTRCVCGWEAVGTEAEVVTATLDHGRTVHNMEGTPEQVLQRAERVEQDAEGRAVGGS